MPLESQLLTSVKKRLDDLHKADPTFVWRKRHGSPMGLTGDPDLHGVWRGHPFEIELKRPGESPTLLQQFRLNEWRKAGCHCFVVYTLDDLDAALKTLQNSISTL